MNCIHHLFANVYHGFQKSKPPMISCKERKLFLEKHIQKNNFDVVILFEMYEDSEIHITLPHIYHLPASGYFIASAFEICNIQIVEPQMTRAILSFDINGMSYLLSHIPPSKYCDRSFEEQSFLQQLETQSENTIVLADLNVRGNHPFVRDHIYKHGWKNAFEQTGIDYLLYRTPQLVQHVEEHNLPSISDHPLFHFSLPIQTIQAQFQILQQNIHNLNAIQKENLYPFWNNWMIEMKHEYEVFFQEHTKNFFWTSRATPKKASFLLVCIDFSPGDSAYGGVF